MAVFPVKMQLVSVMATELAHRIPPPMLLAVLFEKVQLVSVGEVVVLFIPAPLLAVFPEKRQAEKVGALPVLCTPPPEPVLPVALLENVQLFVVVADKELYRPPPVTREIKFDSTVMVLEPSAFPFSTVKPSKTVVFKSLTDKTTW